MLRFTLSLIAIVAAVQSVRADERVLKNEIVVRSTLE